MDEVRIDEHGRILAARERVPTPDSTATAGCRVVALCSALPLALGGFWLFYVALLSRADPDTAALKLLRALLSAGGSVVFASGIALALWGFDARRPQRWLDLGMTALVIGATVVAVFAPFTLHPPG